MLSFVLVTGLVMLGLAACEALQRLPRSPRGTLDAIDLTGLSRLSVGEWTGLGVLVLLRSLFLLRRVPPRLVPALDLMLFAPLIAVSGGSTSPLDPTLPLAYLMAVILLRGTEVRRRTRWLLVAQLLVGLVGLHGMVTNHDNARLARSEQAEELRLQATADGLRRLVAEPIAQNEASLRALDAGREDGDEGTRAEEPHYRALALPLEEAQEELQQFVETLHPNLTPAQLGQASARLQQALDQAFQDYFDVRERLREEDLSSSFQMDATSLEAVRQTLFSIRQELRLELGELDARVALLGRIRERQASLQRSSQTRRATIGAALLLFSLLTLSLRDRLRTAILASEHEQHHRALAAEEQEKNNWIALTAGLTHGLGNDILAYDAYLSAVLTDLTRGEVGEESVSQLQIMRDSNRGRLGFLQFLEAFARQRKENPGGGAAPPPSDIAVVPLFERVRQHLAAVETANLPPSGADPAVDRLLRKFRDLELRVVAHHEDAGRLRRGHPGVIEFFAYELLKNALRSASGLRPLELHLDLDEHFQVWRLRNDVEVSEEPGVCPRCGQGPRTLRTIVRRREEGPACEGCLASHLQAMLESSFEPGKGGGTGLGLFLIRYFLQTYYGGQITAGVDDPAVPSVYFELTIPR